MAGSQCFFTNWLVALASPVRTRRIDSPNDSPSAMDRLLRAKAMISPLFKARSAKGKSKSPRRPKKESCSFKSYGCAKKCSIKNRIFPKFIFTHIATISLLFDALCV
jgi:hypothetical protein